MIDEGPVPASVEEAERMLEAAKRELDALAGALFPQGLPTIESLTWAELGPRDLTDPSETQTRLREVEARFRTLVEQIPAVTFMAVLGEGQNEVYVNPHIEQMLGFTQAEWLADPFLWYGQLHPDDRAMWIEEFSRGIRVGGPFRAECRFLARDGRVVHVHGEARLVKDAIGRPMFLQGIAFDITESKRAQEVLLKQAISEAKDQEEHDIAMRVQTMLLPKRFDVPGLEIAAAMLPAEDVGGDYYDVRPVEGGAWIAIGDVSGHGLNAGLVMLMLQSALAAALRAAPAAVPREVLAMVNDVLVDNIRARLGHDDHITLSLLRYTRDGHVVFAGAHEEMLVARARCTEIERVATPGAWLGARKGIDRFLVDNTLQLEDGDLLVLYTDGVTEARNAAGEQYDIERLAALVDAHRGDSPAQVRDAALAAVRAWAGSSPQMDDISLVVLRYAR